MRNFINEVAQKMEGGFDFTISLKTLLGIDENEIEEIIEKLDVDELSNLVDACVNGNKEAAHKIVDSVNVDEKEIPRKKSRTHEENDNSNTFNIGDPVLANGKEATIKLPHAPNGTVGVMIDGELKMVKKNNVHAVKEGVLGMTPLPGLNAMQDEPQNDEIRRMKELAGVRDVPSEMPEQSPMVPPSMEAHPDDRLPFHDMDFDGESEDDDLGNFDTFGGDDYHHEPVSAETPTLPPLEASEGDYASVERAITEIEDMIPNIKISEYKSLVARLKALLSMAEGAGRSALAEAAKKKGFRLNEGKCSIGAHVKITSGRMKEFIGKTGEVVGKEGKCYRIRLDTAVNVPGVGKVKDDLWEPKYFKLNEGFENGVWVEPNGGGEKDLDSAHGSALFSKRSSEPTQAVEEDDSGESKWQTLFLKGKERGIKTASKMLTFIAKNSGSDQTAVKKWLRSKVKPKADKEVKEEDNATTKSSSALDNPAFKHTCPTCGAKPGKSCERDGGRWGTLLHPSREKLTKEDTIFPKDEKKNEKPRKDSDDEPAGTRKTLMDYVFEADDDGMQTIGANRVDAIKALKARLGTNTTDQQAGAAFDAMLKQGTVKQNGTAFQMQPMGDNAVKQAVFPPNNNNATMSNGPTNLGTDVRQINQGPIQTIKPR